MVKLLLLLSTCILLSPSVRADSPSSAADTSPAAGPLFFGRDNRQAVADPLAQPWQAIGQLETASGNLCTATLVTPHLALTAGHCVLTPSGEIDKAVALRFMSQNGEWRTEVTKLETLVSTELASQLKPSDDGWIVPPAAAPFDFALIRLTEPQPLAITPLPLWQGSHNALRQQLKQAGRRVTQAGYPQDHLSTLYSHRNCLVTGWVQKAVITHQCDTLPGDSGSPLLLRTAKGWEVIAIQSSAPAAEDRQRADNQALTVDGILEALQALQHP